MTTFETENSTYELDRENKRVRRLRGKYDPTRYFGADGEWRDYESCVDPAPGYNFIVHWGGERATVTSPVRRVREGSPVRGHAPAELFAHFRLDFQGGCATLCARRDAHGYRVAVAFCSPRDQFSRRRGRTIAAGRLDAGEVAFAFPADGPDDLGGQLRRAFAGYLCEAHDLPRWVQDRCPALMSVAWRVYDDAVTF